MICPDDTPLLRLPDPPLVSEPARTTHPSITGKPRIAILLSLPTFEGFYGSVFGLTQRDYIETYRNDFSWYYATLFKKHGLEASIYLPSQGAPSRTTSTEGVNVRFLRLANWYSTVARLPVWRSYVGRYALEVFNSLAFARSLATALKADDISVLYVQEYWSGRFDLLAMLFGRRLHYVGADHGKAGSKQVRLFKRLAFGRATAITSQTTLEAQVVKGLGANVACLPNPVDTEYFSPSQTRAANPAKKTILTVARLTNRQKRTSDLIEALSYLDDSWSLVIAGDGPDRQMLERRASELNVADRVQFIGFVRDRAKLRALYRECDVFCLPSASEAVALVVLEAMSCACAVVVTDILGFAQLIEHDVVGVKVPCAQPEALAAGIRRAYAKADQLGRAARRKVAHEYSHDTFMQRFDRLLNDALSHRHKPEVLLGRPLRSEPQT